MVMLQRLTYILQNIQPEWFLLDTYVYDFYLVQHFLCWREIDEMGTAHAR